MMNVGRVDGRISRWAVLGCSLALVVTSAAWAEALEVVRVGQPAMGGSADGQVRVVDLSYDGNKVLFWSDASNIVSGDGNSQPDLFMTDLSSGKIDRISPNGAGVFADMTPDGRKVIFEARGLITTTINLYVFDVDTSGTVVVSVPREGGTSRAEIAAAIPTQPPRISGDGSTVAFEANSKTYVYRLSTGVIRTFGTNLRYDLSFDGRLFLHGGTVTNLATGATSQVVAPLGRSAGARLSTDGSRVFYLAYNLDLYDPAKFTLVSYDVATGARTDATFGAPSGYLTQVTTDPSLEGWDASISDDGTRLYMYTTPTPRRPSLPQTWTAPCRPRIFTHGPFRATEKASGSTP
jgi:Tol biopolymer transport system component